ERNELRASKRLVLCHRWNRRVGVPALAGPDRLKAELQPPGASIDRALADHAPQSVLLQSVPENRNGVEHFARSLEEQLLIESRTEKHLLELFHGMPGMLRLDAIVPGEESHLQGRKAGGLDVQQAVFQFLPESGRRPVLDGKTGPFGDAIVLAAIEPLKL